MSIPRIPHLLLTSAALLALPARAVPPVGVPETFTVAEDTALVTTAANGVLANDNANGAPAIQSVLVTGPQHGSLTLNADGTFTYEPGANFSGTDTFTYRARTVVPPVPFTIDQTQSRIRIDAALTSSAGSASSNDNSRVAGTVAATLLPSSAPFTQAQIVDLDARLIDSIDLQFRLGCLFGACLATIEAHSRTVAGEEMALTLVEPGPPANVTSNLFSQTGNTVGLAGIVDLTATGLAAGQVPDGPQLIDTQSAIDLNDCQITASGGTLTLKIPVNFSGRFFLDQADQTTNYIDLTAKTAFTGSSGFIVATAPASANLAEESSEVTVTINVTPVNDLPVVPAKTYVMTQARQLAVPATSATGQTEAISAGATWKWRYDAADPGTAWRTVAFDDSAWASGPAELGFGDDTDGRPEATNIRPVGAANHPTAYFRRHFSVPDLATVASAQVEIVADDGAVIWINGVEALRHNLPAAPAVIGHSTFATTTVNGALEAQFFAFPLDRTLLHEGDNVIAVEVHQQSATSSDISFDLRIVLGTGTPSLLAGATDVDTPVASLTAALLRAPAHGTVSVQADGGFTYTPVATYTGSDSFVFRVNDNAGGAQTAPVTLVPTGATWKYSAIGDDQGTAWRSTAFDDSSWPSGAAELGYGDEGEGRPEATNIRPDGVQIFPTYYFRTSFTPSVDPALVTALTGRILRDDAAVVYLNGTQVYRDSSLPANPLFTDLASAGTPSETDYQTFSIPTALLTAGVNVVAVEVHQSSLTSSDVSFDLGLVATTAAGNRATVHVVPDDVDADGISDAWERQNGLNYLSAADATLDTDGDGFDARAEFLADTDPRSPASALRANSIVTDETGVHLDFGPLSAGVSYRLQTSTDLQTWTNAGAVISGTTDGGITVPTPAVPTYYRLAVVSTWP